MNKLHDISLLLMLLTLAALGLWSCASNDTPAPPPSDLAGNVVLRITVGNTAVASRAPSTPEGGYDRGEGYENFINLDKLDFRIYFFDKNNRYISSFQTASIIPLESYESSKTYEVRSMQMEQALRGQTKVVVLADRKSVV